MTEPRWLNPEAAAAYIGVRVDQLARLQKLGKLPSPSRALGPRSPRYDRLQLDAVFGDAAANSTQAAVDAAVQAILAKPSRRKRGEMKR